MPKNARAWVFCLAVLPVWGLTSALGQSAPTPLTVFAASDLGPALQRLMPIFEKSAHAKVTVVLGSSGNLAQQIRHGAPADLFFAANETFIDSLVPDRAILPNTRVRYALGRIVLVTLKAGGAQVNALSDLADSRIRRVAIANPAHAPYGLAARQALEASGLWKAVEPKLVYGENVQQAVQFVRSGSADAGIVARSIADSPELSWTLIDTRLHAPLSQMAAVVSRTREPALAFRFLEFVNGEQGRTVMAQLGFLPPPAQN